MTFTCNTMDLLQNHHKSVQCHHVAIPKEVINSNSFSAHSSNPGADLHSIHFQNFGGYT